MIISKFFGLILMLAGGFLLLLSGGCAVLGVRIVIPVIFSANFGEVIAAWPMALLTLLGLAMGWSSTRNGYRMLTGKKDEPPEDLTSSTDKDPQAIDNEY